MSDLDPAAVIAASVAHTRHAWEHHAGEQIVCATCGVPLEDGEGCGHLGEWLCRECADRCQMCAAEDADRAAESVAEWIRRGRE